MIRINLLPTDKRKAERTPLPRFFLIMATAAAAALVIVYVLWALVLIKQKEDAIRDQQEILASLQKGVAEFEKLFQREAALRLKVQEIKGLVSRDVQGGWWRAIDALWTVIHENPKVWIDDVRILDERSVQSEVKRINPDASFTPHAPPYGVTLRCHVAGSEVTEMTRFRAALKENAVLQETLWYINFNPDWKEDEEKDFRESKSLSFSISMWGSATPPKRKAPGAGGTAK